MKKSARNELPNVALLTCKLGVAAVVCQSRPATGEGNSLHDFLGMVYKYYWRIRKSPHLKAYKAALIDFTCVTTNDHIKLSSLLLKVASADIDRRERNRWKLLLEAAYANGMSPREFKEQLWKLMRSTRR